MHFVFRVFRSGEYAKKKILSENKVRRFPAAAARFLVSCPGQVVDSKTISCPGRAGQRWPLRCFDKRQVWLPISGKRRRNRYQDRIRQCSTQRNRSWRETALLSTAFGWLGQAECFIPLSPRLSSATRDWSMSKPITLNPPQRAQSERQPDVSKPHDADRAVPRPDAVQQFFGIRTSVHVLHMLSSHVENGASSSIIAVK